MIVDGDDYTYPHAAVAAGAAEIAELKRQLAQAQAALTKVTAERDAATRGAITLAIQAEQAEAALAAAAKWKIEIPWESLWKYCIDGDYEPDEWREVEQWVRENIPAADLPEVQP